MDNSRSKGKFALAPVGRAPQAGPPLVAAPFPATALQNLLYIY